MKIRTLFIGSGTFAVTILKALVDDSNVEVVGVVTQPDKPAGRKLELTAPPVKDFLLKRSQVINTFQPEKLRLEAQDILDQTKPELIIVAAYGQIIPDSMLNYPKYKCLNLHGSLLPKWRGAVPVHMAILHGETETGISIQRMVQALDEGPVIAAQKVEIANDDTTESLMQKLADSAASLLSETLPNWCAGKLAEVPQDDAQATYCYQTDISKEKAEIKFETPVEVAERMVRAFYPWPIAYVRVKGQKSKANNSAEAEYLMLKIYKSKIANAEQFPAADQLQVVRIGKRLFIALHNGCLELLELQLEGKERRVAKEYLFLAD